MKRYLESLTKTYLKFKNLKLTKDYRKITENRNIFFYNFSNCL